MVTDSSRGTLPSSSRLTIVSSSSIARSKLSFLTSTWVFSAICCFSGCAPCRRRVQDIYASILWRYLRRQDLLRRDLLRRELLPQDFLPENFTRPLMR